MGTIYKKKGEAKQKKVYKKVNYIPPTMNPKGSKVEQQFPWIRAKNQSRKKTEQDQVSTKETAKKATNVPTQVNKGEVTKKQKVFNDASKVVFSSMSTSETRISEMMIPGRSYLVLVHPKTDRAGKRVSG